jgi:Protein of unknown function (DUF2510)
MGMADRGWYTDPQPDGEPGLRYWDGQSWTAQTRPSPEAEAERLIVSPREDRRSIRLRPFRRFIRHHIVLIWVLLAVATFGIVWGAAELHDQTCYSKAEVANGNRDCLLLPWNDPVETRRR